MPYTLETFATDVKARMMKWSRYADAPEELEAIASTLQSDGIRHDTTILLSMQPLRISADQTDFTNDINILVNMGKSGNLSNADMATTMNDIANEFEGETTEPPEGGGGGLSTTFGTLVTYSDGQNIPPGWYLVVNDTNDTIYIAPPADMSGRPWFANIVVSDGSVIVEPGSSIQFLPIGVGTMNPPTFGALTTYTDQNIPAGWYVVIDAGGCSISFPPPVEWSGRPNFGNVIVSDGNLSVAGSIQLLSFT